MAFNFLINYTDQTRMECTELKSFDSLSQYSDYKKYILWEYMGLYDEEYFKIRIKKDKLEKENKQLSKEIELKNNFVNQIDKNTNNINYSINYENLLVDLEASKEEYIKISKKLSSLKKNLIKFRNEKENINYKKIRDNKNLLGTIKKKLKDDKEKMQEINKRYYDLMKKDIEVLNLGDVIKDESIKDILNKFKVGGSNIPLATMMYYMNMLQLKLEFNNEAIIFPVVIDSPNNTESDETKEKMLYNYIFSKMNENTQYIISGIGIKRSDYEDVKFDNIIILENEKYKLLNKKEYIDNLYLLNKLLD